MGLKYVEQIKTVVLFILVLLSVTLTFSIWSYRPNYDTIEKPKTVDIVMDDKKNMSEIVKPYKLIGFSDEMYYGTMNNEAIEDVYETFKNAKLSNIMMLDEQASSKKLQQLITSQDSLTLLFPDEVSLSIFQSILPTTNKKVTGINFTRMTIALDEAKENKVNVYLASETTKDLYKAKIRLSDAKQFMEHQLKEIDGYDRYENYVTAQNRQIYVPQNNPSIATQQYFSRNVIGKVDDFKNALFTNPKIVKLSQNQQSNVDKYSDDRSVMTVFKNFYTLNFSNMLGEEETRISKSHLMANTIGFINEHGGYTNDYRYKSVDYVNQKVVYQLFMSGLPVEPSSKTMMTEIDVKWTSGKVATYTRPYYELENIPTDEEKNSVKLQTATTILEALERENPKATIVDLRLGYRMTSEERGTSAVVFTLTPTWYYKVKEEWVEVPASISTVGGAVSGLE